MLTLSDVKQRAHDLERQIAIRIQAHTAEEIRLFLADLETFDPKGCEGCTAAKDSAEMFLVAVKFKDRSAAIPALKALLFDTGLFPARQADELVEKLLGLV